jgi:hypothetical protein
MKHRLLIATVVVATVLVPSVAAFDYAELCDGKNNRVRPGNNSKG